MNILKKNDGQICQAHRSRYFRHGTYEISPNWNMLKKGKPSLNQSGSLRIFVDGKRVLQHRYIMEQYLGRKLKKGEIIHHRNHDRIDNRIENLELIQSNSQHMRKYHNDLCKRRKIYPKYKIQEINSIIERLLIPSHTFDLCFCGSKADSRNLCTKHYCWAHKHRFFKPRRFTKHKSP